MNGKFPMERRWRLGRGLSCIFGGFLACAAFADNPPSSRRPALVAATPASSAPVPDPESQIGPMLSAPPPAGPSGQVVAFPVIHRNAWGPSRVAEESATILLPSELPDTGFLNILMTAPDNMSLYIMNRRDFPPSLQFLFRDSEELYVAPRRVGGPFSGQRNDEVVSIAYDKQSTAPLERALKVVDAAGNPLTDLEVSTRMGNVAGNLSLPLTLTADGITTLPVVLPGRMGSTATDLGQPIDHFAGYSLTFHDPVTSQSYTISLSRRGKANPTVVMLPILRDSSAPTAAGITRYQGQITSSSSATVQDVSFIINGSSSIPYGYGINTVQVDDPATVTIRRITPAPGGHFRVTVSESFNGAKTGNGDLTVTVNEGKFASLFSGTPAHFKPNVPNEIKLQERLSLTAQLVDEEGKPLPVTSKVNNTYENFTLKMIDAKGEEIRQSNLSVELKSTTGSLFNLPDLPVPGRYFLKALDREFGPIDVSETSPSSPILFRAARQDGKLIGRVVGADAQPLAGALVVLRENSTDWKHYFGALALLPELQSLDHAQALARLNEKVGGNSDFAITTGSGEFALLRKSVAHRSSPLIAALAPDRFLAYAYQPYRSSSEPLSQNIEMTSVTLPEMTTATGVVSAPPMIPDEENRGALKPLPPGAECSVYLWESQGWFADGPMTQETTMWQYVTSRATAEFGKPFDVAVPVGTSYTVAAAGRSAKLSLQLWKQPPAAAGERVQLTSETLRALQPFTLQLLYASGKPAAGLEIWSIYGYSRTHVQGTTTVTLTDSEGKFDMYGDEGLAPEMSVSRRENGRQAMERFKIQKLDMTTSVPTLTVRLDPKIWGQDGEGMNR